MPSLYILTAIFLWSSLGVFVRLSGVEIHVLIFYAVLVSVFVQGTLLSMKKYRGQLPDVRKLRYPVIIGIVSFVNTFTFFYAFHNTTIANAVLTHYTAPVIVALLAPLILKEKLSRNVIVAIILASAGLWMMLGGFSFEESSIKGIIAGLISGVAYALIVILVRMHSQKFHPLLLAFLINVTILLLLLPFIREFPAHAIWTYLFIGIVHSTIAPILYYKGLQYVTANRAAVLGYLEPVCAIILSILFLKEVPGTNSVLGGVFIIVSGYLTLRDT